MGKIELSNMFFPEWSPGTRGKAIAGADIFFEEAGAGGGCGWGVAALAPETPGTSDLDKPSIKCFNAPFTPSQLEQCQQSAGFASPKERWLGLKDAKMDCPFEVPTGSLGPGNGSDLKFDSSRSFDPRNGH